MESYLAHITEDGRKQTVLQHLESTAWRCSTSARAFCAADQGELAGLSHDLGKYSNEFQNRLLQHGPRVDHATAGAFECFRLGQPYAAFAVAGHHSGLPDGGSQTDAPDSSSFFGRMNRALQGRLPEYAAWQSELTLPVPPLPSEIEPQMEGMFFTRMLFSCLVDADYRYVAVPSITNTQAERGVEDFFRAYIQEIPYFAQHPDHWGLYPIQGDGLGRSVCWAMVRGSGDKTIVLVHHYDVVDIEDYKTLKSWAYAPEPLREALMQHKDMLPEEARQDLESGKFLFCRGGCDMEGGGSIQYALLEAYSRLPDFQGNVIVLGVPDEENLSAGMRGADRLLAELQDRYGLRYLMMINSEPHQRKDFSRGVFSGGTVGKMMPFIYVRGFLSHAGKVFEGLNPASVLAEIVTRTEVNMEFSDTVQGEAVPPPMWLYMKDSKDRYDVSMPLTAQECFSVLTLKQTPGELMERVKRICEESFAAVIDRLNASYAEFRKRTGRPVERLPWKEKVVTFGELYQEACASGGEAFAAAFAAEQKQLRQELEQGRIYMIEANFRLIDRIYDYIEDISPRIVYGLMPPYYPNVLNCYFADMAPEAQDMSGKLNCYTKERYGQEYDREYFYTGICDLSYINIEDPEEQRKRISQSMPLFGWYYDIPFEEIKKISMAGINIGPWGKDFHKLTERVLMENLYDRTPHILDHAITILLG